MTFANGIADLTAQGIPLWVAVILVAVVGIGGGAGIVALLSVASAKKKLEAESSKATAEAAEVITTAATSLVAPLTSQVEGMRSELDGYRRESIERDRLINEHTGWDHFVELEAARNGLVLPPRPPLHPPRENAT